ncbi:MAG: hypothetical protein EA425_05830 [Puniceicoccaceae bacterium]|nr:MAG: hypothetical protein EA425_05830 [Puniceicoccaceae bacterium]
MKHPLPSAGRLSSEEGRLSPCAVNPASAQSPAPASRGRTRVFPLLAAALALGAPAGLSAQALVVDTADLAEVAAFHRAIFPTSTGVPIEWSGDLDTADPGETSAAFKDAVLRRINFYRALAGVPADITFDETNNDRMQQVAYFMLDSGDTDPAAWADSGATLAQQGWGPGNSLLLGSFGVEAIDRYIRVFTSSSGRFFNRHNLLEPKNQVMGTGDIPDNGGANATWTRDIDKNLAMPETRTDYIAWPPAGHVPYTHVSHRWSFALPVANFSGTTVSMTRDGAPITTSIESSVIDATSYDAIGWTYDGIAPGSFTVHPRPSDPVEYEVTLNNVLIDGTPHSFVYTVTVFDPHSPAHAATEIAVSGPAEPWTGEATEYTIDRPAYYALSQYRVLSATADSFLLHADDGLDGVIDNTADGVDLVVETPHPTAGGTSAFHLTLDGGPDQNFVLDTLFHARAGAELSFQNLYGIAASGHRAWVEVSLDGGTSWFPVDTQSGSSLGGTYALRSVPLADLEGRTFQLRFRYGVGPTGGTFDQSDPEFGWYIDAIALTGIDVVETTHLSDIESEEAFTLVAEDTDPIIVQARGFVGSAAFADEWGAVAILSPQSSVLSVITTDPEGVELAEGDELVLTAAATGTPTPAFQWFKDGEPVAGATAATLVIEEVVPADAGDYRLRASNGAGEVFSAIATVVVHPAPVVTPGSAPSGAKRGETVELSVTATNATSFQWRKDGVAIAGATTSELSILFTGPAQAGVYSVVATGPGGTVETEVATLAYLPFGRPVNISTRAVVGEGSDILIAGFVLTGPGDTRVLVRGVGPGLSNFLDPDLLLENPRLDLQRRNQDGTWETLEINTHWAESSLAEDLAVNPFVPADPDDAAIMLDLPAGVYTARLRGDAAGDTGIALVEVYMVDIFDGELEGPEPVNFSARGLVGQGALTMIGGFVVDGDAPRTLLVRGLGQGLRPLFPEAQHDLLLEGPRLRLFDAAATLIEENTDWGDHPRADEIEASDFTPADPDDAAILVTLEPGPYTVHLNALDKTGIGIIEIFVIGEE